MLKHKPAVSHNDAVLRRLKSRRAFAAEYLRAAFEDTEAPRVLMIALRRIVEARGGVSKFAKAAGLSPVSLRRDLSRSSDPRYLTFLAVTKAVGLQLTVQAA
jgi:probable addiction module antidote protein